MCLQNIVLIHRCYKVWGAKKKIIVPPVFTSIINNGLALLAFIIDLVQSESAFAYEGGIIAKMAVLRVYTFKSFLVVNFFTNLFIPLMIAGRIWWIGYQVSKFLPLRKFNLTRYIMATCLESGIMYPLALLPALVLFFQPIDKLTASVDLIPVLIQVVGIAPTFIIVRVALGISIENVQDTVHINEENGRDQIVLSMWEADYNINGHV
ncbi:hypothetical protein K435DRAFT_95053 [Dendrothele bispora CBS 962.96]|uniref:Uncharacterized protein n=1 Tax=Dendrothele bispora (strain CBS 962.96) TaxID=1314807 RepID=A0A4S8M319_DENBC|nr:hypothetical protein K435DRAFT_95053 [Dendrothele bispora CBS 962.96]